MPSCMAYNDTSRHTYDFFHSLEMGLQVIIFTVFKVTNKLLKNIRKIQFTHRKIPLRGIFTYGFGIFLKLLGNLLVTLKTVKIYHLQAHF